VRDKEITIKYNGRTGNWTNTSLTTGAGNTAAVYQAPIGEEKELNAKQNNISTKLNKLLDLIQRTKKDQANSDELTVKMENYKLVKYFMDRHKNSRRLTKGDMIACNGIWTKYNVNE
jgi:hypothetical protein